MVDQQPLLQPPPRNPTFGSRAPIQTGPDPAVLSQLSGLSRRLRMVEESAANTRKKIDLHEENSLNDFKEIKSDVKTIFAEIDELRKVLGDFKGEMKKLISEFQLMAKKEEVSVLKKYVQMWEPVQFATVATVQEMIQDALAAQGAQYAQQMPPQTQQQVRVDTVEEIKEEAPEPAQAPESAWNHYANRETEQIDEKNTEAVEPVSSEQKSQIAKLIEKYDDVRNLLLQNPQEFKKKIESDPNLARLFKGVNIEEFSEKLKPHYE